MIKLSRLQSCQHSLISMSGPQPLTWNGKHLFAALIGYAGPGTLQVNDTDDIVH
jgi:hypothetical protein